MTEISNSSWFCLFLATTSNRQGYCHFGQVKETYRERSCRMALDKVGGQTDAQPADVAGLPQLREESDGGEGRTWWSHNEACFHQTSLSLLCLAPVHVVHVRWRHAQLAAGRGRPAFGKGREKKRPTWLKFHFLARKHEWRHYGLAANKHRSKDLP